MLWLGASFVTSLFGLLGHAVELVLGSAGGIVGGLLIVGAVALIGFGVWFWWTNWRANQFFDF